MVQSVLLPVITADKTVPLCSGDTLVLDAGEGYAEYLWSTGATTRTITVTRAGSYTVTVRDAGGCSGVSTPFAVALRPLPIPRITVPSPAICAGDSVTLDAGPGYVSYLWSHGAQSQHAVIHLAGEYSVTVVDSNGCTGRSQSVTITVHPRPAVSIEGQRTACIDATLTYHAGDPTMQTYAWTVIGGSILGSADGSSVDVRWNTPGTGELRLSVSTVHGCIGDTVISVIVQSALQPVITPHGPTSFCAGDSVTLEAETGYAQYRWTTGDSSRTITVSTSGNYSVEVSDASGCRGTSPPVSVTVFPRPDVLLSGPTSVCMNTDAGFSVSSPTGTGFTWSSTRGTLTSGAGTAQVTMRWTTAGRDTVRVTVSNAEGCTRDTSLFVTVNTSLQPVIGTDRDPRLCAGESVTLDAGAGYASYQWSSGESTRSIVVTTAGRYSVSVTDAAGCAGTSPPITVTVLPRPVPVISGSMEICEGDSSALDAGAGYASYLWSNGMDSRSIVVSTPGSYRVTVTDTNGCRGEAEVVVVVHPRPVPVISVQGADLVSTSATTYRWQRDGTDLPGATAQSFTPADSGAYTVTVTDAFGCEGVSAPYVFVPPQLVTATAVIGFGCPPSTPVPAGSIVSIPLRLESSAQLDAVRAHAFTVQLRFDRSVLIPQLQPAVSRIEGTERIITVQGTRAASMREGPLFALSFMAVFGEQPCTPVRIDSFAWDHGDAHTQLATAECEICVEICREGGERLFHATGTLMLRQNRPNPFNATTLIEYELIETGPTELVILDLMGRRVATVASGTLEAGRYIVPFDASGLPSGTYLSLLRTPSASLFKLMEVVK
jgi:hypothetical protein